MYVLSMEVIGTITYGYNNLFFLSKEKEMLVGIIRTQGTKMYRMQGVGGQQEMKE